MFKVSQPLAKSIRTGEGILIYLSNVALVLSAALPHGTSWAHAGLYLTILNGANVLSRSGVKIAAINNGIGIKGGPIEIGQETNPPQGG
jgi:hypothetical protein